MEELLCDAALRGDIESLHEIISRDSFILYKVCVGSFKGKNPLHVAVSTGKIEFVLKLLKIKPDLAEVLDTELGAALHIASSKGYVEIVKALVKVSPKMCLARDRDGNSPLHIAAIKGQVQVLKELVRMSPHRARAKVDQGDTILHLCVMYDQFQCLGLLVGMIPDPDFVNDVDAGGNTILHLAVFEKRLEMIKHVLTNSKIDVNAINKSGRTALDVHFLAGGNPTDSEIQDILLEAGAKRREHAEVDQQFEPSWRVQRRDTFMVVASLIATMAFQVGLNPPGGVWQNSDDSKGQIAGKSVLALTDGFWFYSLMIANTLAFLVSLSTIVLLIFAMPEPIRAYRWRRAMITWSTIIVTGFTYTFSVTAITPAKLHDGTGVDETIAAAIFLWIAVMTVSMVRSTSSTRKSQNVGHGKGSILKAGGSILKAGGAVWPRSVANAAGGNHQSNV